jgi:fatty acid desaturase
MKELMRRSDYPAVRDTLAWLGAMGLSGALAVALYGAPQRGRRAKRKKRWLAAPFFLVYGVLYGSSSDSRWHESGHGTAFKTTWMNDALYQLASFMNMKEPTLWRWSHARHHTDTLILGRDREIAVMRPARLARILANFFGLVDVPEAMRDMALHACGRLHPDEAAVVPESERPKVYRTARLWAVLYAATVASCFLTGSWLPLLLVGGPRMYGAYMMTLYGITQHAGLGENVLDYRLNTRTVLMNRLNRFLYWNMNYHIEHHMFPMVPYHKLPELHEEVKHDLPDPYPSLWAAYKEIVPAVVRQLKDPTYYIRRQLPPGAAPYNTVGDGRALPYEVERAIGA